MRAYDWIRVAVACLVASGSAEAAKKWRTYEDVTLISNASNDGDSFHARVGRRHYIFRLYFVDAPETDAHLEERLDEQARYWGTDRASTMALGREAKAYTERLLKNGFTVITKRQDARGASERDRFYAVIRTSEGDLAEALVQNGLARVYGMGASLPDGPSEQTMWWRLKTLEREAKLKRLGGWGLPTRAGSTASMPSGASSFKEGDAFAIGKALAIYSVLQPGQARGFLRAGARVNVVGTTEGMVRVRFRVGDGKAYEGLCLPHDLQDARINAP